MTKEGLPLKWWHQLTGAAALAAILAGCGITSSPSQQAGGNSHTGKQPQATQVMRWSSPPAMTLNTKDSYQATVHTTAGSFVIQLFSQQDPVAVNNFVFLAQQHFYDNNQFFRVLKSFVIQTGDPLNKGTGGPGYTWNAELPPPFPYQPGIVAMAINPGNVNSNGSQFFICTGSQSQNLNSQPDYTEVGRVIKGWTVVQRIASGKVTVNPLTNEDSYPLHPYRITSITIQTSSAG